MIKKERSKVALMWQPHQCGFMNVVSYDQIAFEKLIFQARPGNAHA